MGVATLQARCTLADGVTVLTGSIDLVIAPQASPTATASAATGRQAPPEASQSGGGPDPDFHINYLVADGDASVDYADAGRAAHAASPRERAAQPRAARRRASPAHRASPCSPPTTRPRATCRASVAAWSPRPAAAPACSPPDGSPRSRSWPLVDIQRRRYPRLGLSLRARRRDSVSRSSRDRCGGCGRIAGSAAAAPTWRPSSTPPGRRTTPSTPLHPCRPLPIRA